MLQNTRQTGQIFYPLDYLISSVLKHKQMKSVQKYYNIISVAVIAALVVILLLLGKCRGGVIGDTVTKHKIDTVTQVKTEVRIKRDTLTEYISVNYPQYSVPFPVYVDKTDTTVKVYVDSLVDSNLTFRYSARVRGQLLSFTPSYTLPKRTLLERQDSIVYIKQTIKETIEKYRAGFYIGGGAGYNVNSRRVEAFGGAALTIKQGFLIGYDFDFLNNAHRVTLKYRVYPISKKPK